MSDRVGFLIGQDFVRYNRKLPEEAPESVKSGYETGRQSRYKSTSNRFINKWLQLRYNAYLRNKIFSTEITPELIKSIDTKFCPITGVRLTHSTGKDTDWSIDRVSNDFDYIPTNLLVMATRANKAKGDKSADEIIEIATTSVKHREGLSVGEWKRMAELVQWTRYRQLSEYELEKIDSTELFISSLLKGEKPFANTSYSQVAVFQMYLLKLLETGKEIPKPIDTKLNRDKSSRLLFHKLWKRLVKREPGYLKDEQYKQWSNQTTLILYVRWVRLHNINDLGRFLEIYAGSRFTGTLNTIQLSEEEYSR